MLDPKQLSRIEAVHRGFMYQHLFATGCLLMAHGYATSIRVERDEDIEVISKDRATYVQVKTRSRHLLYSDIEDALERFTALRAEHILGRRTGEAQFVFVSNVTLSDTLRQKLQRDPLLPDVSIVWPHGSLGPQVEGLPPVWSDISAAAAWCTAAAEKLPLRLLASESLVWKVAAHVALAASGTSPYQDHSFQVAHLPALFEQILIQLQEFPEPLHHYRPQQDEPAIEAEAHLRIICGFSGAGKTSWAAQAAAHSASSCVYYDAADVPAAALAAALVRESASQLRSHQAPLDRVLAPGATGLESLRALDEAMSRATRPPILVIDNAHNLPATTLDQVSKVTRHFRLILLCHPVPMVAELEALTGVSREELKGWSLDGVAAETIALGCHGPIESMERLRVLTGGYPLFVQGAARLAAGDYAGDLAELCVSLERGTHSTNTAQEAILARVFEALPQSVRHAAGLLSLSDVALSRVEATQLLRDCIGIDEVATAATLRHLRMHGIVQLSGASRVSVHDAMRILGKLYVQSLGTESAKKGLESLKNIILKSLLEQRDSSRFGAFARLLASLNHLEPLIDLIGEELFHEMGVMPEVIDALERALASGELPPDQQFWAHDGLLFSAMKHGGGEAAHRNAERSLEAMEQLLAQGVLTPRQQGSLWMKKMLYEAELKNSEAMMHALEQAHAVMPEDREHVRIYKYNAACAMYKLGRYELAEQMAQEVIPEYYDLLGISPEQVIGMPQPELQKALKKAGADIQDIKHLADALELLAMTHAKQGQRLSLARMHAMRFYEISGAVDSVVRTGLDMADAFVWTNDFDGARQIMEDHVLPYVREHRLTSKLLDARSLYAVILAYSGRFNEAELEMNRLAPLVGDAPAEMQEQIAVQNKLIADLRVEGVPPQRQLPHDMLRKTPVASARKRHSGKVGRNDLCPCGSGQKFKRCHGST